MFVTAGLLDPAGQPLVREVEGDTEIMAPDGALLESEVMPGDPLSGDLFPDLPETN